MVHEWSVALNVPNLERDSIRLCSKHFLRSDYQTWPGGKRTLKRTAIPRTAEDILGAAMLPSDDDTGDEAHDTTDDVEEDVEASESDHDLVAEGDFDVQAEESVTDMSVNDGEVGGGGDLGMGGEGAGTGDVEGALQAVEEATDNIVSGSNDEQIRVVRRKLRSLRVKCCFEMWIAIAAK